MNEYALILMGVVCWGGGGLPLFYWSLCVI